MIPKGTTHEFWMSVHFGALKAAKEFGVDLVWKGPLAENDRQGQINEVETFINRGVSGICLAPLDDAALRKPVAAAVAKKIPVVIFDSGLKSEDYTSFVATDNYKGGQLAGEHLAALLGGKGNVILLRYAVGSASTEAREAGFLDALKKHPDIKLISSDQYAGPTRETGYQASQNLLNRFGNEVNGIFCPNENSTIGMTMALREIGKAGGIVKMVGFDSGTKSVMDLKNGDVQGLVVQNPLLMGYLGVMTMVKSLQGEKVEKRIDTGVVLATPENMDQPQIKELLHPPIEQYLKE
jgi:ribose transport system substrate-binding protein